MILRLCVLSYVEREFSGRKRKQIVSGNPLNFPLIVIISIFMTYRSVGKIMIYKFRLCCNLLHHTKLFLCVKIYNLILKKDLRDEYLVNPKLL